jgi:hypothetical protein
LVEDMQIAVAELNSDGYEVVNVTPLVSGSYNSAMKFSGNPMLGPGYGGAGYGYGYSFTKGVVITARKATG